MIVCGPEQPIRSNEMIKAVSERGANQATTYTSSRFTDPRLNRFSFVWLGHDVSKGYDVDDATEAFSPLVRALAAAFNEQVTAVWRGTYFPEGMGRRWWADFLSREKAAHEERAAHGNLLSKRLLQGQRFDLTKDELVKRGAEAEEKTQSRLIEMGREGWDTAHRDILGIAARRIEPSEYHYNDARWSFVVVGPMPPVQEFADESIRRTMESFPYFAPDRAFLLWLAERSFSICYEAKDTVSRPGIIVVGQRAYRHVSTVDTGHNPAG